MEGKGKEEKEEEVRRMEGKGKEEKEEEVRRMEGGEGRGGKEDGGRRRKRR